MSASVVEINSSRGRWMDQPAGYSQFDNRVLVGLATGDFSGTECAVIMAIIANTWRYQNESEHLNARRLSKFMGRHIKTVEKTLRSLKEKSVVTAQGSTVGINPDTAAWITGARSESAKERSAQAVSAKKRADKQRKKESTGSQIGKESTDSQNGNLQITEKEPTDSHIGSIEVEPADSQEGNLQTPTEGTYRLPDQEPVGSDINKKNISKNISKKAPNELSGDNPVAARQKTLLEEIQEKHPEAAVATKSGSAKRWGTAADAELAQQMHAVVTQVTFDDKPMSNKTLASWANEIRLMREQDERSHPMIWKLFDYAHRETAWGKWREQILSPGNLRDKWAKLAAGYNAERNGLQTGAELKVKQSNAEANDWAGNINGY